MSALEFTGERFVPGVQGEIWVEHWHRYHFASRWVAGRRVLDIACGEGYGSALLARTAREVVGVDVSAEAVAHAARTYAGTANLSFMAGSCGAIPLPDASIEVAVSFETVEHIAAQREFMDELARVLSPGGVLILSCPNKREYSDRRGFVNEFHVRELYREELEALVAARFPAIDWYGQKPTFFSLIAPERAAEAAQLVEVAPEDPSQARPALSEPLYFVLAASRERSALDAMPPVQSVLSDRSDWAHRDYEKVMKWLEESVADRRALQARLDQQQAALSAASAREAALAEQEREIERRAGWRWWLRLPLVRLGLLK